MVEDPLDVFPVWVSLTSFFPCDDSRARCLMSAVRGRTSRWLARRLRRTLQLPTRVSLRVRGHLLPPAEPLALLQSGDTLEAIPAIDGVVDISREVSPSLTSRREVSPSLPPAPDRREVSPSLPPAPDRREVSPSLPPAPDRRARKRRYSGDPPDEPPAALPSPLPAPLVALPASSPVQGSVYEDTESLVEMKRRALHLLEHHVEPEGSAGVVGGAGGRSKRRRRVRRRRPPPTPVLEPTHVVFTSPPPVDNTDPPPPPPLPLPPPASSSPHSEECMCEPAPVDAPPSTPREISIVSPVVEAGVVVRGGAAGGAARCVRALATPCPSPARGISLSCRDEPLPPLEMIL